MAINFEDAARELTEDLQAVGIPIDGVAFLAVGAPRQPGWHVVERPGGIGVRIDYQASATPAQITQGDQMALNFVLLDRVPRTISEVAPDVGTHPQRAAILNMVAASYLLDHPKLARALSPPVAVTKPAPPA